MHVKSQVTGPVSAFFISVHHIYPRFSLLSLSLTLSHKIWPASLNTPDTNTHTDTLPQTFTCRHAHFTDCSQTRDCWALNTQSYNRSKAQLSDCPPNCYLCVFFSLFWKIHCLLFHTSIYWCECFFHSALLPWIDSVWQALTVQYSKDLYLHLQLHFLSFFIIIILRWLLFLTWLFAATLSLQHFQTPPPTKFLNLMLNTYPFNTSKPPFFYSYSSLILLSYMKIDPNSDNMTFAALIPARLIHVGTDLKHYFH